MASKPLTIQDSDKAPSVSIPSMPSGSQNKQPDCGYEGKGSAPITNKKFWTGGPSDISGGH